MTRRRHASGILVSLLGLAAIAQPSAAQTEVDQLSPNVNWILDYAEDSCALRRTFGAEGQIVFLELRQYSPGQSLQMLVTSADYSRRIRRLAITFAPDSEADTDHDPAEVANGEWGTGFLTTVSLRTAGERELDSALSSEHSVDLAWSDEARNAREAEIAGIMISGAFREPIYLQTGSLHPAMNAMRTCLDELLTHWGIDVEAHRNLLRPVRPLDMDRWSRELITRYPHNLLRQGEQAYVRIRLNVTPEGRASDCNVQTRLNNEEFDTLACELMLEHARFEPALDRNGDPIASYWLTSVIYRIG